MPRLFLRRTLTMASSPSSSTPTPTNPSTQIQRRVIELQDAIRGLQESNRAQLDGLDSLAQGLSQAREPVDRQLQAWIALQIRAFRLRCRAQIQNLQDLLHYSQYPNHHFPLMALMLKQLSIQQQETFYQSRPIRFQPPSPLMRRAAPKSASKVESEDDHNYDSGNHRIPQGNDKECSAQHSPSASLYEVRETLRALQAAVEENHERIESLESSLLKLQDLILSSPGH